MSRLTDLILKLFQSEYRIAYREVTSENTLFRGGKGGKYKALKTNWRFWYADPILWEHEGKLCLFVEKYDMIENKGHIAISYYDNGEFTVPKSIIIENFHMSFPHVFRYKNYTFMVPECSGAQQIRIYIMGESIDNWSLFRTFDYDEIVDVVTYVDKKRIYFIASENNLDNLYQTKPRFFYIDDLLDFNCDLVDITDSVSSKQFSYTDRNGGALIEDNSDIIRVKQESTSRDYGKNCIFTKIVDYNENVFDEKVIGKSGVEQIKINMFPLFCRKKRTHSYAYMNDVEVVDVNVSNQKLTFLRKSNKLS
ncbi:MAG: hypothetical protein MJ105_01080 [Lachnospiraceae bacterium]|nr:hypothetical protein [Lachnospiraceae bacterium]